jgi:hypothetical protein
MLSGLAAWERSVCDGEDETAVSAGVPAGGVEVVAERGSDDEGVGG